MRPPLLVAPKLVNQLEQRPVVLGTGGGLRAQPQLGQIAGRQVIDELGHGSILSLTRGHVSECGQFWVKATYRPVRSSVGRKGWQAGRGRHPSIS